jgi:NADH-quinone oxidoreductase subunit E
MFNLAPVGRHYVQVCGTTPCWLRGANEIKDACRKLIGEPGQVTGDGLFSWSEVECLGACVNAPVAQINKDYYEDLTPDSLAHILAELKAGRRPRPGPQNGRQASAPLGGPATLLDPELYRNEAAEDAPAEPALADEEAKRPGAAANLRERAVPKPPLAKGRKPKAK